MTQIHPEINIRLQQIRNTITSTLPLSQEGIILTQFISTSLLLCIIWMIIEFSLSSSSSHLHLDLDHHSIWIIITRSGASSLNLDHLLIWIIITRSRSSLDLDQHHQTGSRSSLLDHHHWILISTRFGSSLVLSHDSSHHRKFYRASPFSCQLQSQPSCRYSPSTYI